MKMILPLAALLALPLAACGDKHAAPADNATADQTAATSGPVQLPPSIAASKTFRCADSTLVYVDFMSDSLTANIHMKEGDAPVRLTAPAAGEAFAGDGYVVEGNTAEAKITLPGKAAQNCKS